MFYNLCSNTWLGTFVCVQLIIIFEKINIMLLKYSNTLAVFVLCAPQGLLM